MKKRILFSIGLSLGLYLVIGLAETRAYAQVVQAKIPFNYIVSGKTFPAGEYTMTAHAHQLKIADGNGRLVAMAMISDSGRSSDGKGQIVFHCYRDRCFLAEVWSPSNDYVHELLTSRTELEAALEQPGKLFAILGADPGKGYADKEALTKRR